MKKRLILAFAILGTFVSPALMPAAAEHGPIPYRKAVANSGDFARHTPVAYHRRSRRYARRHYHSSRYYSSRPRYVVRRRSKAKSAAIIGGSAAAGAGIGALAGGGKGAAIGALAGGAGGLIYDRKTHKKIVRRY